ncbi:hypothetical protein [Halomicrobium sp. LC1Hm]|uniref:hypothetical protein n=1 Tax=Halomicrobium sp. LC1Hm TaxID=2610902 RepID=UPI0012985583|nr:hypothetical protein [Halomicrobium sp. LC1Hm]QGA82756.1 hypothetical protein LC1Hm_1712 [Halomicrobium sp. LC1Hm]
MGLFDGEELIERGGFRPRKNLEGGTCKRVIDEEAGVVLYAVMVNGKEGYGLTAVPIEDTDLTLDNENQSAEGGDR